MGDGEVVAFLLTDVVGSTRLWEAAPEAMADSLARHDALIEEVVTRYRGTLVKSRGEGDSTFSVFRRAGDAAAAALVAQEALTSEEWPAAAPLWVRMAIHIGEASERQGDYYGGTVNRVARLRAIAQGGEILVTQATADALAGYLPEGGELVALGMHSLRDLVRPEGVYRLQGRTSLVPSLQIPAVLASFVPLPPRLASLPSSGFVGRGREIDLLARRAAQATEGTLQVVLVRGEPGVGKTRLASEAARRAHLSGTTVLYGRSDEEPGIPYLAFVRALRHYVEFGPKGVLEAFAARHGGHLARLIPQLAERVPDLPAVAASDPETERYLLFEAVVQLLVVASRQAPLLLVLDDLHWADRNSLLLLRHVVQSAVPMRVLIVATYRESDVTPGHPLEDVLATLVGEHGVDRLGLRGLDDGELTEFVAEAAGHGLDEEGVALARWLRRETDGNPFFAYELLRHLVESEAIERVEGKWTLVGELEELRAPDSVREVVGRRVTRLGDSAVQTLTMAAVIGRDFHIDLLAEALEIDEDDVLDTLERAGRAALVNEVPTRPGQFSFAHALIGHSLYQGLGATRRCRAHRRVAQALETLCGADPGPRLPELAGHWLAARAPAEVDRTVDYARRAGDHALEQLAPDDAARWYEQALALSQEAKSPKTVRCELLIALGVAQRQAGDDRFRSTLLDAARLAQDIGDADALVRAALANNRGDVSTAGQVDIERVEMLEKALAAIDPTDSPTRARLLATVALETNYAGDWERRLALSDEALGIARRLGDLPTLAAVFTLRHEAIRLPHTLPERLANTAEHLELADRIGDPLQRAFAAHWRARCCWETGDMAEIDRCMAIVDELGVLNQYLRWNSSTQWSYRLLLEGRMDEAEQRTYEAFMVGQEAGQPDTAAVLAAQLVNIRWDQGRLAELEPMLQQAVVDNPGIPGFRGVLAHTYCEIDRFDDARALFEADAADDFAAFGYDAIWVCSFVLLAEVCAQLGDEGRAPGLYERLVPWRDQIAFSGASVYGSVSHYLGQLAGLVGRYDQAEADFAAAAARHEQMGAVVFLARTRLSWARMLARRGAPGDDERARSLAGEAMAVARSLGASTIERRAAAFLEEVGHG